MGVSKKVRQTKTRTSTKPPESNEASSLGFNASTMDIPAMPTFENFGFGAPSMENLNEGTIETTGRFLVALRENSVKEGIKALSQGAGLGVASSSDFSEGVTGAQLHELDAFVFEKLGVAVINAMPEQIQSFSAAAEDDLILAIEPERVVYAAVQNPGVSDIDDAPRLAQEQLSSLSPQYLRGYRDAVNYLTDKILGEGETVGGLFQTTDAAVSNQAQLTWGLQATNAAISGFSGRGVKIAVLDTGFDLAHPDFTGRTIVSKSFVPNEEVQDLHGHGTHCIGTACGPRHPSHLPRYGVAYDSDIYVGKVLNNQGRGDDGWIMAGIEWAIENRCSIISMSIQGRIFSQNQAFNSVFEITAQRALAADSLIIAAAGNHSRRPDFINPVAHPANCPSIMSVAAIDEQIRVGSFSNGGFNPQGGQIDIAAPGVAIRSSYPQPALYRDLDGTSMATPHVAGIAALFAEAFPDARGLALYSLLVQRAQRLQLPSRDVGAGLVQAP